MNKRPRSRSPGGTTKVIVQDAEQRIRKVTEGWFITEPLLFAVWTLHRLAETPDTRTIRTGQGRIEYNPAFILGLEEPDLKEVLRLEAYRILLKHPYLRRKPNARLAYEASDITLAEHVPTHLPLRKSRQVFETSAYDRQYFELYYQRLAERKAQNSSSRSSTDEQQKDTPHQKKDTPDQREKADRLDNRDSEEGTGRQRPDKRPPIAPAEAPDHQAAPTDIEEQGGKGACQSEQPSPSSAPQGGETPASASKIPEGNETSRPWETPAPETPAPETPAPETPAPETPAPETPAPETPAPETPAPETEQLSPLEKHMDAESVGGENAALWDYDELQTQELNERIREARESNQWGTVPGTLQSHLIASLAPKLNYRKVLRLFRASILSANRERTRMKPSRRYGFDYMGSRYACSTLLLFAVDVSGSVSDADIRKAYGVINGLFRYGIKRVDAIQFDTELKGEPVELSRARKRIHVLGRGGTSFSDILRYIDENRAYDGLIIFTDGYAPIPKRPKNRGTRVLWLFNTEDNYRRMRHQVRHIGRAAYIRRRMENRQAY